MFIIIRSSYCGPFDSSRIGESFKSPSVYSYSVIQWPYKKKNNKQSSILANGKVDSLRLIFFCEWNSIDVMMMIPLYIWYIFLGLLFDLLLYTLAIGNTLKIESDEDVEKNILLDILMVSNNIIRFYRSTKIPHLLFINRVHPPTTSTLDWLTDWWIKK